MSRVWIFAGLRHLAFLGAGALIGGLYGYSTAGLAIAAIGLLGWHLFNLQRLTQTLSSGSKAPMISGNGLWSRAFARVDFLHERNRFNRKRWRRLVKEFQASAKAFPDGGVILNTKREILNYNKSARRLLGLKKKRDRGMRIDNLIRHPDFVEYLETGSAKESVEIPAPVDDETWLSCRLIPYGPEQSLLLVRDITPSVNMERTRRDFVANASHELRSPLTVIAGYLDALSEDTSLPGAWVQPVTDMREQTARMGQLVDDLLQLSKLEASETCGKDKSVDILAILRAARKDALSLPEHPREIDVDIESDVDLLGDETEIQSVVWNLVSNAVRYTPEEGRVRIVWRVDENGGHLAIEDTGIGIREEDIPRVTERFYRVDVCRARQKGGTGLGLAIVKHALKRHDGELEIRSQVGKGSEFICHFPRKRLAIS